MHARRAAGLHWSAKIVKYNQRKTLDLVSLNLNEYISGDIYEQNNVNSLFKML